MLNWHVTEMGVSCMVNAVQWSITYGSGEYFTVQAGRTTVKMFSGCTLGEVKKWVEENA